MRKMSTLIKDCRFIFYYLLLGALVVSFFMTPAIFAGTSTESLTPQDVLTKFESRLKGVKNYAVETEERSKTIGPRGIEESSSQGRTLVKGKKRYNEVTIIKNGEKENQIIQILDGDVSWLYDRAKKEAKKVNLLKLSPKIREKIKSSQDTTDLKLPEGLEFTMEKKKEGKRQFYVLTSQNTVTISSQKYEKIVVWIDAQEYLPFTIQVHMKINMTIPKAGTLEIKTEHTQEFKNWQLDADIPDSTFSFNAPEGVKVIDATQKTEMLYERYVKDM